MSCNITRHHLTSCTPTAYQILTHADSRKIRLLHRMAIVQLQDLTSDDELCRISQISSRSSSETAHKVALYSQSEADFEEHKEDEAEEANSFDSFEWPLWAKRLSNPRQNWGLMPPQPPPSENLITAKPRGILKRSNVDSSPAVNPNSLIGIDELRLQFLSVEQPPKKKCAVQEKLTQASRKISSECLHEGVGFSSFISAPSTGTFRDTMKRQVPTLEGSSLLPTPQKNDSWGTRDQTSRRPSRSSRHAVSLSANSFMLRNNSSASNDTAGQGDLISNPSTGSFMDAKKRHVHTLSAPNQEWNGIISAGSSPNPLLAAIAQSQTDSDKV